MSTDPNDIPNAADATVEETVTATVTRTVTTASAEGKETVVFSSTDVKSIKLSSDPAAHTSEGGDELDEHEKEPAPVLLTRVQHSEQISANASDGLTDDLLNSFGSPDDGEGAGDSVVQQLLADMLRAGLKPKGPNTARQETAKQTITNRPPATRRPMPKPNVVPSQTPDKPQGSATASLAETDTTNNPSKEGGNVKRSG